MTENLPVIVNPSHLKLEYLQKYAMGDTFIETGTYLGDTVKLALEYGFKHIHSIEIDEELYKKAVELFKGNPEVTIHLGDSVSILPTLISDKEPQTYWLDAHASGPLKGGKTGPCPLVEELRAISGANVLVMRNNDMVPAKSDINSHTIFIDDRRLLGSPEWGGVQEGHIAELLHFINPDYNINFLDGHQAEDVIVASVRS